MTTFVAYVTRHGVVELLGPARSTREEIEAVVERYRAQGWDNEELGLRATYVGLGETGPWIIPRPQRPRWWRR